MKYPATWEEYKAQKQNRKAAGDSTAASGSSPLPATWEEYKAQKQAKAQQLPATQTDTAEREKCLNASGFKAMQTDMQGLFGTMDGYFSTYHKIGASSKWQKDQVSKMLQNVAQEKDYFNRYADVMGEDAQSYQKQLNAWEAQLKRYQKAMNGQEDDEGSLALGSGIARFQTEADAYFKKAQETTAGMSEPERANQWLSGAQTLLTEAQEIEAYLKQKNTPAAQTLLTQMAEYRKALEDMQTSAKGAQLTNPLTGKAMPDVAISGRMRLPRYTADGKVQTGYGSAYDRRLGQQEGRTLAAGMERKAEKADWQNQTVQQHEDYIRQDFEELKAFTHGDVSDSQAQNIHAGIFTEIAERLNYLALSGKCTESEYEALLDKVEQWKKEYLSGLPKSDMMWANSGIDDIRKEAKSLLPSKGDAMKEFRYQSGSLTRENIAYTPVDELLGKMGFDHGGTDWGTSDAERRAVTFLSEEVLPEYLANTEMTQEQYDAFMQQIADAPNAAELRATREANGLNANEAGMQSALEMYREIDAKTYADMAGTGAVNAMENVMTKYAGGMEQVLMRGLGYLTKAAGKTLNLFGLAENPVGNYFVEGGQQGIDYENKDWQAGKQREYEAGRYASELTQNGNKFTKFTANMTRDLTQAALEMAAAGAIAGQISAGNAALSQLSQGGKYASSLANAQKRVSGYTKLAGQMANLMKNSSNVLISANAALNSYGEAEDAGRSMPERAVKLIAGGLIEYGTNGLFGGNPIVDPENAGLISKYITDLTDNETIRKIVSSKVFDRIGEGMEEVASAVAGAALDYALTGETDLTAKELVDEFTVGVLLSMVMSAPEDIVDLTARAKSYVQSKVITRFGKQAQSNLDVLYGTMAQYTAQYYAGDENLMRFNGWSESQIKKAKGEWNTIVREFNTLADRLESAQNISESFERYTPPQANGGFVDVEMQNIIRAEQQSNAALMTDRALDIQIITQRATIEALRGSTDATDIFMAESAQSYLDVLDAENSARAAERAQRAAESAAQENIPTTEQTAQEAPQTAQETAQSAAETVEQAEEINAPAAQETEGGMSNEQSQSVNENQERNERVGAEGQTGGVVESGSRIAADRGGTGEGGGNESENLRRQKLNERVERFKGTVLDTGMDKLTADGDPDVMVGIVPVRKYTQAMKQAQREAKEQGVKTTFVVGTMSIKGEDGEYHNTDAMFDAESGRIFVSVSSIYEPEVLMEHELFHAKVHAAEIDLVTALESVSENMTAEEYTEIVEQYMKAYRGAYDSDAAVYEEILADAYAGLNRFANRSFKKLIDAMRTHAAGMQSQRESSAPTAEVSKAVRRTQDSDGNEKTAQRGGTRASMAGPKAKTASSKNLALAEAMEEDGASREEIWRKTGWIRGADGQWRFEVDDSKAEFRPNGDARLMGEPRYRRLEELTDKWGDSFEKGGEPLTEAEEAEMEALQEEYSDRVWEKKYELQDFLKHDELYEAYPLLRHTTLRFEKLDPGVKGKFDKRSNTIVLSDSLFGKGPETLLHEIQHIIQKYEGFQGGTSPEYWARRDYESGDGLQERLQREYSDILNGLTKEEQNDYIRYQEIDGELERLFYSEKPGDTEKYDRLDAEHDRLYEKLYPNEWFGKLLDLKRQMENPGEVYLGQYINSAGEIEARETASRRKLTAEERKNKMPDLGWDRALLTEGGEGTSKVQFSLDNPEGFAEAITQWDADGRRKTDFILGSTGEVLQGLGAIESDVYMRSEKIETILKQHPEMSLEEIKKIPSVLNDPVLVLKSRQSDSKRGNSRVVVFGSMKNTNGAPMLAVLDLRPVEGNLLIEDMQKVVSAYVKTGNPAGFLKNSEAMFVDKKRAARLLRSTGLQLRPGSLPPSGYIGSITYRGKNVNITGKQFSEFLQETKETGNENLTTIRNLNEDDLEALYGSARIPVQELLTNTEGAGDVSLIVKNEDTRNNNAHLENMAAVIPSSVDWWLVERLKMNGLNVVEYRAGNEQARQEAEADAEKLLEPKKRFSLSPEEKVQRAENKLTAAQEKLEQEKEKAQERYKRDLTSGMRRLFNIQSYDSKELNGLLETPMLEMQQGVKLLKAEKDDLFEAVMNLGTETMPADDYYREIRDTIYGQKVFVPEWVRTEFGDDWNSFKKRAMGRHKFYFVEDEGKQGIDQLYKELAEQYPGAFPGTYDMTEMLRRMEDMADKGMDTKLPYRQAMEENEKRFGMTVDEQTEYQRTTFERLLNSYAEKAGRDARIAQDKAAKAEANERLESILREADSVKPTKKAEGVVEPWTISEAAAQKRGFPLLNGKQVYPLRTWVKAADMGNYGLVLDKSTKKGMLTVLFTNKETGLSSVKDMETKLLTAVEPKYQPSVQETAALLASMPPEKLEDAADAEDLGAFYEWYDGQTEGRETNDLRPVAEERAEKSRQAAQEIEKQRGESVLEKQEAYEQKKAERIEGIRKAYLESFGTTEPKLPYGKDRPMQSRFTTLQPGEALSLLQAMTGTKWALTNNADGTWKATMTKDPAQKTSISPKEALERLEAAKKTYGQQIPGVHPEGIAKENFKGSPALEKAGVKIDGGIADYGQVETMRKGAETRRSVKWQIDKTIQRMDAKKPEIRAAKKIAQGKQEYYRLPDKCRPEVVSQLAALYLNERMTGEDLIQVRKSEIRDGLFYKMMELFPTENEIMANPELFKAEKLLVLNYRTALRSMVNIFGEERGMEIYNYLFAPVIRNTAESYRWTNQQFDDVKEFTDSSGKKSRLNETERAYVHMMLDVEGYVEKAEHSERGDILKDAAKKVAKGESISNETIEFALNSEEAKIVEKYAQWINGKDTEGIDKKKCENAMQEYRKKFDLYFEAINDFLVAHGMQPIGRIQGYTPHMPLAEKFNFVQKALDKLWNALGVKDETVTTLPAEISGRTEFFRPQKRWNPFFLERKTDKTAYDIEEAFQNYVRYLGDILFHTDDIQKVRAAESYLRKGLRGNFVDDLQKAIDMSRSSDKEEKIEYLQKMEQIGADDYDLSDAEMMQVFDRLIAELVGEKANETRYSPLVIWLKNYGDILAGKQFGGDRGMEYTGGRKWLNIGNKLVNAFAKANVAGNLSSVLNQSAQLAMLQATRSQRAILKATQEFCTGKLGEFRKEIDFLTGKKGIDYLVQSGTDKFISGMFAPAEFMDSMLSTIATRAAYWDAIQNGKNHEEAMRFADWYGRALMGDRTKGAKPLMFFSKNPFVRMLNVFQIEPLNTVEFATQDMPLEIKREAKEHGKKSAARMLLRTIFGYLIAAFVLNRLTDELYGGTPAPLDIAGLTANFFASGKGLPTNDYIKNLINKVVGSEIFDVQEPKEGFDTSAAIKDTGYNLMNEIPFASNASGLLGVGDRTMPMPNIYGSGKDIVKAIKTDGFFSGASAEAVAKLLAQLVPGGRQLSKTGFGIKALIEGGKTKGYGEKQRLQYPLDMDDPMTYIRTVLFGTNATPEAKRYYAGESYGLDADQTQLWMDLRDEGVNGYMLYGLMMRMDDAQMAIDVPKEKENETEAEEKARLQAKEARRKAARAELAAQEGLTDRQKASIYGEMVSHYNDDAIDKLIDAGMKWKDISEILDKRGELSAGAKASEWAAEFASWLDGKKYSGKNREAINEALVPQSASFYNKMTAAGVSKNNALKVEKKARALAGENDLNQTFKAQAIMQSGLSDKEAYAALGAVYTGEGDAKKFKEAQEEGIPAKAYAEFRMAVGKLESDKDEDGKSISGSRKEKVIELIDSLSLTAEQKDWIMGQEYKSYDWWMMPWS